MPDRALLSEVAEAIKEEAWLWEGRLAIYDRENPNDPLPPNHPWVKRSRAFNVAAKTLAVMASYEDRSREFVTKLLKDYSEGRWP